MKKMFLLFAFLAGTTLAAADQAVQPAASAAQPGTVQAAAVPQGKEEPGVPFCLARGICNIATGWMELPRCMFYDNTIVPIIGLFAGIPEGAFFAVGRTFCGVFDLVSFGMSGSTCHGEIFPDFVFQSKWVSGKK